MCLQALTLSNTCCNLNMEYADTGRGWSVPCDRANDMHLINSVIAFLRKPARERKGKAPEGTCVNCWGVQEYDNMIRVMFKEKQIDVNNHEAHYAFIQDFVVTHLEGIHLKKEDDRLTCPNCHIKIEEGAV